MCTWMLFGTRNLILALLISIPAGSLAQEKKAPVTEHFPLEVKLLGFLVTDKSSNVILEIEGQTIVLQQGERKNVEFTSPAQVRDGEKKAVVNRYKCQLNYESNGLDVVNKKLRLALGNYLSVDCLLGKAVRSGENVGTSTEVREADESQAEVNANQSAEIRVYSRRFFQNVLDLRGRENSCLQLAEFD